MTRHLWRSAPAGWVWERLVSNGGGGADAKDSGRALRSQNVYQRPTDVNIGRCNLIVAIGRKDRLSARAENELGAAPRSAIAGRYVVEMNGQTNTVTVPIVITSEAPLSPS